MMLGDKERVFGWKIAELMIYAVGCGFRVTVGTFLRPGDPRNHGRSLAADLNLHRWSDGADRWVYLRDSESHLPLGLWWEAQTGFYIASGRELALRTDRDDPRAEHLEFRWGGRFLDAEGRPKPDGNHYSIEHGGIK